MRVIRHYLIDPRGSAEFTLGMPQMAEVMEVISDNHGMAYIVTLESSNAAPETKNFSLFATGHVVPDEGVKYVGSFWTSGIRMHVFERIK